MLCSTADTAHVLLHLSPDVLRPRVPFLDPIAFDTPTETPRNGWGLRAERDLEVGEILAVIPRSMCLGLVQPEGESARDARKDVAWTGPPCLQALVEQVPEEFADVRCATLNRGPCIFRHEMNLANTSGRER